MENQENLDSDGEVESVISIQSPEYESLDNFGDDDIMQQKSSIFVQEAEKVPLVGDKASSLTKFLVFCIFLLDVAHFYLLFLSHVCVFGLSGSILYF